MANPAPTINQINAFNATQGTIIDFNIIGGTELVRSNKIYIYDLSDNSLICTHLYVSTESIHELPPNTDGSIVYESGKSSADFVNGKQYYAQIQTFTDIAGTQGGSGLSVSKLFWCLVDPSLTIATIPSSISTTSYNVSATYDANTSVVSNIIQQYQFNLYSATGSLLQSSGVIVGNGEQQGTSTAYDISYNFSGLSVGSSYYVAVDVTTTQGMSVNAQSSTFTISIDTPTLGEATVVNNACDGYISVTSNLSSEYGGSASGEIATFETDSVNNVTKLEVELDPIQDGTPWQGTDVDSEPYQFRAMPQQSNDYNREYDTLVGGTVNWNQWFDFTSDSWTILSMNVSCLNGKITLQGTANLSTTTTIVVSRIYSKCKPIYGHKYLLIANGKTDFALVFGIYGATIQQIAIGTSSGINGEVSKIINCNVQNTTDAEFIGTFVNGQSYNSSWFGCFIDLTAFFGNSATADYVYSLEQANAGAGITWLRKYFPDLFTYSPYNTGTLESVKPTAHVTRGVNQWDEEWENGSINANGEKVSDNRIVRSKNYISCLGGATYYQGFKARFGSGNIVTYFYDANKNFVPYTGYGAYNGAANPPNGLFTAPTDARYMLFRLTSDYGATYNHDICINISDPTLNGKYYPADHHTYPISELELRGYPTIVDGELVYDGDTRKANGQVSRRYEIVDLGTLNWTYYPSENAFYCSIFTMERRNGKLICSRYTKITGGVGSLNNLEFSYQSGAVETLWFKNTAYTVAADFKAAMSGVYLLYEKKTPTTETADPFTSPQVCNPYGTEEYVTTNIVPVGHQSRYALVCPITGHDEVEVTIYGKNLFETTAESKTENGITWTVNDDGSVTVTGTATGFTSISLGRAYVKGINSSVKISNIDYAKNVIWESIRLLDENDSIVATITSGSPNPTFTVNLSEYPTACYIAIGLKRNNNVATNTVVKIQVEIGEQATDWVPYVEPIEVGQDFNVTLTPTVIDETPYLFKKTGDVRGDRESLELVGGTVNWNQLVQNGNFADGSAYWAARQASLSVSNGVATITPTTDGVDRGLTSYGITPVMVAGHKYLMSVDAKVPIATALRLSISGVNSIPVSVQANTWTTTSVIWNCVSALSGSCMFYALVSGTLTTSQSAQFKNAILIDLTAFFGNSATADYVYSLETATAGAGIAWLRKYFPALFAYSPYNTGTLESVKPTAHVTRGVNQWDEETESGGINQQGQKFDSTTKIRPKNYIRVFPSTVYYFNIPNNAIGNGIMFYDADKNFISYTWIGSASTVTTPSNANYMLFDISSSYGTTYNHDICINISDANLNGKYFPADHHTYPISELELRGIPKLVDGELRFDGDTRKADGSVSRKWRIADLGVSGWIYNSANGYFYTDAPLPSGSVSYSNRLEPLLCGGKYICIDDGRAYADVPDKSIYNVWIDNVNRIAIKDSAFTDGTTFRASLSGVNVLYPLASTTTETADPFTDPQEVSIYGTEEFVSSNGVPVGNKTTYKTRDIFGGKIDLASGVLTVEKKGVNLGDYTWGYGNNIFTTMGITDFPKSASSWAGVTDFLCEKYAYSNWDVVDSPLTHDKQMCMRYVNGSYYVRIADSDYNTVDAFKKSLDGTMLVYPLAEPLTYQLIPHEIETLIGSNNVWSNAGDVLIEFNIPITNLLVKRQDVDDVSGNWLTLYSQPVEQASDMDFTFIDFLNQYGKTYKYALVPLLAQTQSGVEVEVEGGYTVSDEVQSIFDGVYIGDSTGVQRLKAGVAYNNLNTNQQVGVIPTLGNKYPIIVSNGNIQYDTGSVSGLIVPDDFYSNGNLSRLDMSDKREVINDFLINKKPKILKDWNGNIWLVVFTDNVDVSFDNNYGMGIATFTSGWTEVGDPTNQEDLQKTGLINVGGD